MQRTQLFLFYAFLFILSGGMTGCFKSSTSAPQISGTITVSPAIAPYVQPTDTLYIIARSQQVGPPTAVKRIEKPQFPLRYVLTEKDMITMSEMPKSDFSNGNPLTLSARLSKTGNAMPATGDLEGVYEKNPAEVGQDQVDIQLRSIRQ